MAAALALGLLLGNSAPASASSLVRPRVNHATTKAREVPSPAMRERLLIRGGNHTDPVREPHAPANDPSGGSTPASPSSVPGAGDPRFDDSWCGVERPTDDAEHDVTPAPRFKVVYAYPADRPDRFSTIASSIQHSLHSIAQMVMVASGNARTLRFDLGTSCGPRSLDIASVPLPLPSSEYEALTPEQFTAVSQAVSQAVGTVAGPHTLLIFIDTAKCNAVAGRGDYSLDESPGPGNVANQPSDGSRPRIAEVLHCGFEEYFAPPGAEDTYLSDTPLHEIAHTLGAVSRRIAALIEGNPLLGLRRRDVLRRQRTWDPAGCVCAPAAVFV